MGDRGSQNSRFEQVRSIFTCCCPRPLRSLIVTIALRGTHQVDGTAKRQPSSMPSTATDCGTGLVLIRAEMLDEISQASARMPWPSTRPTARAFWHPAATRCWIQRSEPRWRAARLIQLTGRARGRGLGRAMLLAGHQLITARGAASVTLGVDAGRLCPAAAVSVGRVRNGQQHGRLGQVAPHVASSLVRVHHQTPQPPGAGARAQRSMQFYRDVLHFDRRDAEPASRARRANGSTITTTRAIWHRH